MTAERVETTAGTASHKYCRIGQSETNLGFLTNCVLTGKVWSLSRHFFQRHTWPKPRSQSYGSSPPPRRRLITSYPTPEGPKIAEPPTGDSALCRWVSVESPTSRPQSGARERSNYAWYYPRSYRLGAIALSLASVALLGCKAEAPTGSDQVLPGALERFGLTDWSEPQLVGPPVNTTASEQNGTLAKDGLTLYFTSDRSDGRGGLDIWISKRLTTESPWGTPENLEAINTPSADFAPNLSTDGHLLFFSSNRPGVLPVSIDIFVSRRADPNDDQGWGPPTRWGPGVNTPDAENAPMYLQSAEDGSVNLYFNRGVLTASLQRCGGVDPRRWAGDLLLVDARRGIRASGPPPGRAYTTNGLRPSRWMHRLTRPPAT